MTKAEDSGMGRVKLPRLLAGDQARPYWGIAFDPGLSTGVCRFSYGKTAPTLVTDTYVIPDGITGFIDWYATEGEGALHLCEHIIYEDFEIDGTITGSWASEIIGALKLATGGDLICQKRQDKWGLIGYPKEVDTTQKRETFRFNWLREKGFDGKVSHELDAITHALVFMKGGGHVPTLKEYWGG